MTGWSTPSSLAARMMRRSNRRNTYPRPSLPGLTPSAMMIAAVRVWSAMIR
jgi:hypothetical protein